MKSEIVTRIVDNAKVGILEDIRDGHIPKGVVTYSELHDYRDANMYLLLPEDVDNPDFDVNANWAECEEAMDIIEAWLPTVNASVDAEAESAAKRERELARLRTERVRWEQYLRNAVSQFILNPTDGKQKNLEIMIGEYRRAEEELSKALVG
jgi:hypothetical protein